MHQDPLTLIATYTIGLYVIVGPLILLAIYALFDALSRPTPPAPQQPAPPPLDPALWTAAEVSQYFSDPQRYGA